MHALFILTTFVYCSCVLTRFTVCILVTSMHALFILIQCVLQLCVWWLGLLCVSWLSCHNAYFVHSISIIYSFFLLLVFVWLFNPPISIILSSHLLRIIDQVKAGKNNIFLLRCSLSYSQKVITGLSMFSGALFGPTNLAQYHPLCYIKNQYSTVS
jgi:hypothetical protein